MISLNKYRSVFSSLVIGLVIFAVGAKGCPLTNDNKNNGSSSPSLQNFTCITVTNGANCSHIFAIRNDGSLWGWGRNGYGQLGVGDTSDRSLPTQSISPGPWKDVATGENHTIAVKTDGTLWACGGNGWGKLGLGYSDGYPHAFFTQIGTDNNWAKVASGLSHILVIKTDGTLWAWGNNDAGQLGVGDNINRYIPTKVGADTDWVMVDAGNNNTTALKSDGTIWVWGFHNGSSFTAGSPTQLGIDSDWKTFATGGWFELFLKNDGSIWGWGENNYGQIGVINNTTPSASGTSTAPTAPIRIGTENNWKSISCGTNHSLAIKNDGTAWTWGDNGSGQLGINSGDIYPHPDPIQVGTGNNWQIIIGGGYWSLGIRTDGLLWIWGAYYGSTNSVRIVQY